MRRQLIIILLAMVGLFLGTTGFTQEKKGPGVEDTGRKTSEKQRINTVMVEKILGSKVLNLKGESLGEVENLVVDIDSGKIAYVVLECGGFLGIGDKLFPVPWEALAALPSEGIFFLNQSKEQMQKAPAFDKKNLPDMTDTQWGEGIYKHYSSPGDEQRGPAGFGYYYFPGYEHRYGSETYPDPYREEPFKEIFDSGTIKTISGQVIKVDRVIEPGFGTKIRLTVFIDKNQILPVYLGPAFYIIGNEIAEDFKIGDQVTVSGSQVTRDGVPFMIAINVKRGNEVLRFRDKDGNPEWIGWRKASE